MAGDLVERPAYLIRKQGYWYRPKASGYTSSAIQAGRYTLAEAERYTHPNGKDGPRDGMDYVHEDDVVDPDWVEFRKAADRIAALEAALLKLADDAGETYLAFIEEGCDPADAIRVMGWISQFARTTLERPTHD